MPADRLLHPRLLHSVKVCGLSDVEFRVWVTYILTADDYGVMRKSAVTVQAANDVLAERPVKQIDAALKKLVDVQLVLQFEHQKRAYLCQIDWQNYQRVKHPRDSMQPVPPDAILEACTAATRKLFAQHNSLRKGDDEPPEDGRPLSGEREPDGSPIGNESPSNGSLARARTHETANGLRLPATGDKGVPGDWPPMDVWARELVELYPAQGRCGWNLIERSLFAVLTEDRSQGVREAWEALKARLEQQQRSRQWLDGKIPRLDRWLRDGLHLQLLPEVVTARPARDAWECPHVDPCGHKTMCDVKLLNPDPSKYPVREKEPV
jgi:hypothetical protein